MRKRNRAVAAAVVSICPWLAACGGLELGALDLSGILGALSSGNDNSDDSTNRNDNGAADADNSNADDENRNTNTNDDTRNANSEGRNANSADDRNDENGGRGRGGDDD